MPSWKIHEKWSASFGLPKEVCKKVNIAIDKGFKHDAGKDRWSPFSVNQFLLTLSQVSGVKVSISRGYVYIPEEYLENDEIPIPDEYIVAGFLHLALDVFEDFIIKHDVPRDKARSIVDDVEFELEHLLSIDNLAKPDPGFPYKDFRSAFLEVLSFLRNHSYELYDDIVESPKFKDRKESLTEKDELKHALMAYCEKKGFKMLIRIVKPQEQLLPLASAVEKIYSILKKGEEVEFGFADTPYSCINIIKAKNLKELLDSLETKE
ncbi:MAG: hypothetical protein ACPLZG_12700 [Thermoproteota archaeon]